MKGSCTLVASVLAASTVAVSSTSYASSSDPDVTFPSPSTQGLGCSSSREKLRSDKSKKLALTSEEKKFAPRFDGLRFIETLVTAHRSSGKAGFTHGIDSGDHISVPQGIHRGASIIKEAKTAVQAAENDTDEKREV